MFLQLVNYKAFQFLEQKIHDTKISHYLKTVIPRSSRNPQRESVPDAIMMVMSWEGGTHAFDLKLLKFFFFF